jgi:hypothetical protein
VVEECGLDGVACGQCDGCGGCGGCCEERDAAISGGIKPDHGRATHRSTLTGHCLFPNYQFKCGINQWIAPLSSVVDSTHVQVRARSAKPHHRRISRNLVGCLVFFFPRN